MKDIKLIATILSILTAYAAFLFCLLLDSGLLFKDLLVTDEKKIHDYETKKTTN